MSSYRFPVFNGLVQPQAHHGEGIYVIDENNNRFLDACGGAGISCLGHSQERITDAIIEQAKQLSYAHPTFFTSEAAEALAADLISDAPEGLTTVYFGCGGSEQVDGTLKMARQYFVDRGEPQRTNFIARRQSFHGNTLGSLGVANHVARREPYLPILASARHVSPCYAYRGKVQGESDEEYALRLADELEQEIIATGPQTVIAFVAEPIVGATMGAVPAVPGYFKRVREICDRYGILLILDEVMCGMGRSGARYTCDQEGVIPDFIVLAKGLGAGYQPISATLVSAEVCHTIMQNRGFFQHGHSYMGHPIACAAALAAQQLIRDDNLISNVQQQGEALANGLKQRFGDHEFVGDIRGRGLLWAIELVQDRDLKQPFSTSKNIWMKILLNGLNHGLMCYPSGGTADGVSGDHVLLAPPFDVSSDEVETILSMLEHTLIDTFRMIDVPLAELLAKRVAA